MARRGRSAGVLRPWHAGREASKNLGGPRHSWAWKVGEEGIQLLRHGRGNPDTEQCWHLSSTRAHAPGKRRSTVTGNARWMRLGVVSRKRLNGGESPLHGEGPDGS